MKKKKKKNSVVRQFFSVFFKSFICIFAFCLVGFISYKVTMFYYENIGDAGENETLSKYVEELKSDGEAELVSKNLILAVNSETGAIKRIVIEIFNSNTGNLDYITVPIQLEFTMSYDLYKKLASVNPDVPQIVCMKKIHKYFEGENRNQCAQLLLEDVMDISFSYHTIIPFEVYKSMFRSAKGSGVQKWTAAYQKEMEALDTKGEYEQFFKKYYEKVQSNLSETKKCTYISGYLKGGPKQVAFYKVSGENSGKVFALSIEETNSLINMILNNSAYTEENQGKQVKSEEKSSIGLSIEILNSTKINGLASSFQEKLIQEGMNVSRIGNYDGTMLAHTKIVVKKEGYGKDLLAYFKDATIEIGQVGQDVDICIIIGEEDG